MSHSGPRTKIILFTGAPLPQDLTSKMDDLITTFSDRIARFAGLATQHALPPPASAVQAHAPWHSLPLTGEHLPTGFSQLRAWTEEYTGNAAWFAAEDSTFLTAEGKSETQYSPSQQSGSGFNGATSQFYERSLALHDDLPTSQVAPIASFQSQSQQGDESTGYGTSTYLSTQDESVASITEVKVAPQVGQITSLNRLPNAGYLTAIEPQTMSVNIICGIISISSPRSIKTRHGGTVDIVETLMGDETKSGFGINFWLSAPKGSAKSALREALRDLRPQDIIMIRNMALSSFKGQVYGQSLRKEMTKVDLMFRKRIDRLDRKGCYNVDELINAGDVDNTQLAKTRRVREWVLRFVGARSSVTAHPHRKVKGKMRTTVVAGLGEMPPDTQ